MSVPSVLRARLNAGTGLCYTALRDDTRIFVQKTRVYRANIGLNRDFRAIS
jgi:hypothetical protein